MLWDGLGFHCGIDRVAVKPSQRGGNWCQDTLELQEIFVPGFRGCHRDSLSNVDGNHFRPAWRAQPPRVVGGGHLLPLSCVQSYQGGDPAISFTDCC